MGDGRTQEGKDIVKRMNHRVPQGWFKEGKGGPVAFFRRVTGDVKPI